MKLLSAFLCVLSGLTQAADQRAIAESFAAQSIGSKIITDDSGQVIKLAISRHAPQKPPQVPPGVTDTDFPAILKLSKLEAVFIEKMPLSDASYALLGQLKTLKDVRIHYPTQSKPLPNSAVFNVTDRFAQFLNELPGLRLLQLKHIFGMNGDAMKGLKPQPELEHLEIDTVAAKASAVPFVTAAKKLRNLQVHRCDWTDADLQIVLAALPELEVFELKPNRMKQDGIGFQSLRGFNNCPKLKLIQLAGNWSDMTFENGLDALLKLPALQQVSFATKVPDEVIHQLHKAKPDLLIQSNGKSLGGKPGQKPLGVDDGYDWGGSVTTHG
jgi:hypothetical protein